MKQKDILVMIVIFFILAVTWIITSIWHSGSRSTISEETSNNIAPIEANFDTKTIKELKTRKKIIPSYEREGVTPTPVVFPTSTIPLSNATGGAGLLQ